jgi:hypothetical protein
MAAGVGRFRLLMRFDMHELEPMRDPSQKLRKARR